MSTWADIQKQLELQGFAAVMMHPYEFGGWDATNGYANTVNQDTLSGLRNLLQVGVKDSLKLTTSSSARMLDLDLLRFPKLRLTSIHITFIHAPDNLLSTEVLLTKLQ